MASAAAWSGDDLLAAFAVATRLLDSHRAEIDALNVFPVPDGDTGTNMSLTMTAALNEAKASAGVNPAASLVAERFAHGALLGARGNSGVILSQIYRGFARAIAARNCIDGRDFAAGLRMASQTAYHAVMNPVEGTMLTVIRVAADHADLVGKCESSFPAVLEAALIGAREALADTPNLLVTLRQAGLVDSGGRGLVIMLEGLLAAANGQEPVSEPIPTYLATPDLAAIEATIDHDRFGYCTNFLISGVGIPFERARAELAAIGQSAVIVGDDQLVKVHLHTEHPGRVLELALTWGSLSQIKIDNMDSQAGEFATAGATASRFETDIAVIAVTSGPGIAAAFRELGGAEVISDGGAVNPSVEEILAAVGSSACRTVVLLPNDSNVLMAADQVRRLSARPVIVVPTRTIPQGLSALSAFRPNRDLAGNIHAMTRAIDNVTSIEIARAGKNATLNDIEVRGGQFIALVDDQLAHCGDDLINVVVASLHGSASEDAELATLFVGSGLDEATRADLHDRLASEFSQIEFEFVAGGQSNYLLVIALE